MVGQRDVSRSGAEVTLSLFWTVLVRGLPSGSFRLSSIWLRKIGRGEVVAAVSHLRCSRVL